MWLENLKELKKAKGMTTKQIADATKIPESTLKRIFSGETDNPYVDTIRRIAIALGSSLDEIFAESKTVVGGPDLLVAQVELEKLKAERDALVAENGALKEKIEELRNKVDTLRDEIIETHHYYMKSKS